MNEFITSIHFTQPSCQVECQHIYLCIRSIQVVPKNINKPTFTFNLSEFHPVFASFQSALGDL